MIRRLAAAVSLVALVTAAAAAQSPINPLTPGTGPAPAATYMPLPPVEQIPTAPQTSSPSNTPPPGVSTPNPTPPPNLLHFTGQLLDVRDNFVYFTTGDAFEASPLLRITNYDTGLPTTTPPRVKMFARATFDPASKKVIELAITTKHLANDLATNGQMLGYAVSKSKPVVAAELSGGQRLTGKQVAVVFEVTAPPTTALTDQVYISTDASGWSPTAIKLDRVDAYKYRAQRYFASGTRFAYRVTRGSWNSVERGEDNLDPAPHQFFVAEVDSLAARVTVYHWSDENPANQGASPNSIPTPYYSNPFGGGPGGIAVPQNPPRPTPVPGRNPL
jgi:hypothetical protein